jgi:hypothetical protein
LAGKDNLRDLTTEEARKIGKKGGIASGKARRKKADLRQMAQDILSGTYTDKNGREVTGEELVINTLIANLENPNGKNWGKALDTLIELTGAKRTPEEKEKMKAETEMLKAKAALMKGEDGAEAVDDGFIKALNGTAAEDWQ